jgi:hypothetical protein
LIIINVVISKEAVADRKMIALRDKLPVTGSLFDTYGSRYRGGDEK